MCVYCLQPKTAQSIMLRNMNKSILEVQEIMKAIKKTNLKYRKKS